MRFMISSSINNRRKGSLTSLQQMHVVDADWFRQYVPENIFIWCYVLYFLVKWFRHISLTFGWITKAEYLSTPIKCDVKQQTKAKCYLWSLSKTVINVHNVLTWPETQNNRNAATQVQTKVKLLWTDDIWNLYPFLASLKTDKNSTGNRDCFVVGYCNRSEENYFYYCNQGCSQLSPEKIRGNRVDSLLFGKLGLFSLNQVKLIVSNFKVTHFSQLFGGKLLCGNGPDCCGFNLPIEFFRNSSWAVKSS